MPAIRNTKSIQSTRRSSSLKGEALQRHLATNRTLSVGSSHKVDRLTKEREEKRLVRSGSKSQLSAASFTSTTSSIPSTSTAIASIFPPISVSRLAPNPFRNIAPAQPVDGKDVVKISHQDLQQISPFQASSYNADIDYTRIAPPRASTSTTDYYTHTPPTLSELLKMAERESGRSDATGPSYIPGELVPAIFSGGYHFAQAPAVNPFPPDEDEVLFNPLRSRALGFYKSSSPDKKDQARRRRSSSK